MFHRKKSFPVVMLMLGASLMFPISVYGSVVDYNVPGDLAANFNFNDAGAGNKYSETTAGGLLGSRAVATGPAQDAVHTTALFNQNSFSFANAGDSVTISQFVLRQNDAGFPFEFSFMQLGILQTTAGRLGRDAGPDSYVSLRILSDVVVNTGVFLQSEVRGSADTVRTQQDITGQTANLIAGNWYRFTATFDNLSSTQVRITGALEDWGTTGSAFQSTILELTTANPQNTVDLSGLSGTTVLGDSQVWGGWRGFGEGGAALFDDFSIVPEPTSFAFFGACALLMLRRRRSLR